MARTGTVSSQRLKRAMRALGQSDDSDDSKSHVVMMILAQPWVNTVPGTASFPPPLS